MIYFKIKKIIILILFFGNFFLFSDYSNASQNIKIIIKIDNSIITSEDINYELNYLIALNEDLNKLKKKEVYEIAKESLVREKIKKKEIRKYLDIENYNNDKLVDDVIKNVFTRLGFKTNSEFEIYLNKFDLSINEVREKLSVEMLWNQLISVKYKDRINVNEDKIRKKIQEEKINYQNLIEYDLSEIIFSAKNIENLNTKTKKIREAINNTGFETAAIKFSISDTANFGGNIGKVNENQLSKTIKDELQKIDINEYTNPINIGNNFLIIKVNEKNFIDLKLDENEILERMMNIEKKRQYENFSLVYYNKIKLNSQIDEF
tara:strand:- start:1527 stop:2486 length:960 start_codon:yes stop_codon:yes gene_type:complete